MEDFWENWEIQYPVCISEPESILGEQVRDIIRKKFEYFILNKGKTGFWIPEIRNQETEGKIFRVRWLSETESDKKIISDFLGMASGYAKTLEFLEAILQSIRPDIRKFGFEFYPGEYTGMETSELFVLGAKFPIGLIDLRSLAQEPPKSPVLRSKPILSPESQRKRGSLSRLLKPISRRTNTGSLDSRGSILALDFEL